MSSLVPMAPDLKIYCFYHNDVITQAIAKGYSDPGASHMVYMKVAPGPFTLQCQNHIDYPAMPWYLNLGYRYAESETLIGMYKAYMAGQLHLPEYVGFCHWDMKIAKLDPRTPMTPDSLGVFCTVTGKGFLTQHWHRYLYEPYLGMLRDFGISVEEAMASTFVSANAFCCHRDVFCSVMRDMCAWVDAGNGFPNPVCDRKRDLGEALERLMGILLHKRKLKWIRHHIGHALITSSGRSLATL